MSLFPQRVSGLGIPLPPPPAPPLQQRTPAAPPSPAPSRAAAPGPDIGHSAEHVAAPPHPRESTSPAQAKEPRKERKRSRGSATVEGTVHWVGDPRNAEPTLGIVVDTHKTRGGPSAGDAPVRSLQPLLQGGRSCERVPCGDLWLFATFLARAWRLHEHEPGFEAAVRRGCEAQAKFEQVAPSEVWHEAWAAEHAYGVRVDGMPPYPTASITAMSADLRADLAAPPPPPPRSSSAGHGAAAPHGSARRGGRRRR